VSGREVRDYIADIAHYAETAVRLVGEASLEEIQADERTVLALERAIEIMGEAAAKLPPEFRSRYHDIPWPEMIGTRHRLAHGYFATELAILHRIAQVHLPPLLARLRQLAMEAGADRPPDLSCPDWA
jgi:uncharacterized protein with HEPN domain